jgi:hypothetical protein
MNKIFGVPVAILAAFLVVGLASAALVNYLSNSVSATATVESPLELKLAPQTGGTWQDSLELGTVYGGDAIEFRLREKSRSNQNINSTLAIVIAESGKVNVCEEVKLSFREQGNTNWHEINCAQASNNLEFKLDTTVLAKQDKVYEVKAELNQRALGNYTATIQHIPK